MNTKPIARKSDSEERLELLRQIESEFRDRMKAEAEEFPNSEDKRKEFQELEKIITEVLTEDRSANLLSEEFKAKAEAVKQIIEQHVDEKTGSV